MHIRKSTLTLLLPRLGRILAAVISCNPQTRFMNRGDAA